MISSWSGSMATGNPTTLHWWFFFFFSSIASPKSEAVPRRGPNIVMPARGGIQGHNEPFSGCCWDSPVLGSSSSLPGCLGALGLWQRRGCWSSVLEGKRKQQSTENGSSGAFSPKNHLLQAFLFFAEEASQALSTSVFLAVTFRPINSVQQKRQEKTRIGHHQTQQNPGTAPSPQPPAAAGRQKPPEPWRVAGKESLGKINSYQAEL